MNKKIYIAILALSLSFCNMMGQVVDGVVKSNDGAPMAGVKITQVGVTSNSAITDKNGVFTLTIDEGEFININYADITFKRLRVKGESMSIVLDKEKDAILDLGFIRRTADNSTQAVSSVNAELLSKSATMMPNNALYGLISGLDARQNVGWNKGATLNIRGRGGFGDCTPLILVDGFERDMKNLSLEEIESVQVLKDGASTALYGARGANGVVIVTTKRGIYNGFDIDVNYRHGFNIAINQPRMADAYTYAKAQNEALYYDGISTPQYTENDLNIFQSGVTSDIHPNVDWAKEGLRNCSENNQFNIALRGGGKRLRYFAAIDYNNDFGLLSNQYTDLSERYNSEIRKYDLGIRMNLDVDVTSSTHLRFNIYGMISEDKSPNTSIDKIFSSLYKVPAAAFPIRTTSDNWGSSTLFKMNPIAAIADVGYIQNNRRSLTTDIRLIQDLSVITKGLSAELAVAYDNMANFRDVGSKTYKYEVNSIDSNGKIDSEVFGNNSTLALSKSILEHQLIRATIEAKVGYDRTFGLHQLAGAVVYRQEGEEPLARNTSYYRQNVLAFIGYNYDNRYMIDVVGNYYGSSVLLEKNRFNLYPAVSLAWNISNEAFMKNKSFIDLLKLRASWGRSATDNLSYGYGNYYWTSGKGYSYGNSNESVNGMKEGRLAIDNLKLETADKYNVGVDLRFLKHFTFSADAYYDKRSNMLVSNNKVSSMVGVLLPKSNLGKVESKGLELSFGYAKQHKDYSYYVNANWALNDSKIIENGEKFQPYDYLYRKGDKLGQFYGLQAVGYFNSAEDIANSPTHTFSEVRPGDVKYKDINNDNKIDREDVIALGKSTSIPDMVFGLNFGFEYKGFGVDVVFQGVSGMSRVLNVANIHRPLRNGKSNVSMWYLKDKIRWTENTKATANLPRLSTLSNENNYQASSQWLEDGSFLKLRNLNVYYTLPDAWTKRVKLGKTKIYARAQNLFSIDKIKDFNCEDIALGYPDLFSLYVGLNINF